MFSPKRKRFRYESEDDAQDITMRSDRTMDFEDEHEDYEDSEDLSQSKEGLIPPHLMLEHVESFHNFVKERNKLSVPWSRMKTLFDEWLVQRKRETAIPDSDHLLKSLKKYLAASLKINQMSMETCFRNVQDYLDRPESVLMCADFPAKPPALHFFYARKHGLNLAPGKTKELADRMKGDPAGRRQCEEELAEIEKTFVEKLEEFLSNNSATLRPKQREYVEHKIKLTRKKLYPTQRTIKAKASKPTNGATRSTMTAFDLFCQTKKDKYTDLPEEQRLKKLQKKFNKLPEDKKEIFEKLALVK
ncbi:unnamed protein product [Cylicocyclus nassatus]|uniref:Uncharacterized protein n=1 Tax=Cylicocyclus nassatus TaxID=53992 RepID=A0AA36GJE1_CYLNA|nr:unnamed protein product [Cylicocyclus nassatus]